MKAEPVAVDQSAFEGREKAKKAENRRKRETPVEYSILVRLTCFKGLNDSEFKAQSVPVARSAFEGREKAENGRKWPKTANACRILNTGPIKMLQRAKRLRIQ